MNRTSKRHRFTIGGPQSTATTKYSIKTDGKPPFPFAQIERFWPMSETIVVDLKHPDGIELRATRRKHSIYQSDDEEEKPVPENDPGNWNISIRFKHIEQPLCDCWSFWRYAPGRKCRYDSYRNDAFARREVSIGGIADFLFKLPSCLSSIITSRAADVVSSDYVCELYRKNPRSWFYHVPKVIVKEILSFFWWDRHSQLDMEKSAGKS